MRERYNEIVSEKYNEIIRTVNPQNKELADFEDWYGDKNAKVLLLMVYNLNPENTLEEEFER